MPKPIKLPDNEYEVDRDYILKKYTEDEILNESHRYIDEVRECELLSPDISMGFVIDYFNISSLDELRQVYMEQHSPYDEAIRFHYQKELSKEEQFERGINKLIRDEQRKVMEKQTKEKAKKDQYQHYLRLKKKFEG